MSQQLWHSWCMPWVNAYTGLQEMRLWPREECQKFLPWYMRRGGNTNHRQTPLAGGRRLGTPRQQSSRHFILRQSTAFSAHDS